MCDLFRRHDHGALQRAAEAWFELLTRTPPLNAFCTVTGPIPVPVNVKMPGLSCTMNTVEGLLFPLNVTQTEAQPFTLAAPRPT